MMTLIEVPNGALGHLLSHIYRCSRLRTHMPTRYSNMHMHGRAEVWTFRRVRV